jgi:sugar transferase (PEP-CTERM/EpsH1 system associated)
MPWGHLSSRIWVDIVEKLLLLVHRIPYPPNKGDKIRSYHLLQHLSSRYQVYLGAFIDDADDWRHVPRLQELCAGTHFAGLHPMFARLRSLTALAAGRPLSCDYYRDAGLRRWVDATVAAQGISRIVCYSSPMAQYASHHSAARRVMDFVDVDSDKWRQYATGRRWPMRQVYQREARCLLAYEREVAAAGDAALFVSAPEAQLFRALAPECAARIGHYSNGVDAEFFSPDASQACPYPAGARVLAFTGAMDYWPNIDAVTWFARDVLPAIRAAWPARDGAGDLARRTGHGNGAGRAPLPCACHPVRGADAHCPRHPEQGARSDGNGAPGRGLPAGARGHRCCARDPRIAG